MIVAFFDARRINLYSGGAVIAPWDLLDGHSLDDWAEAAFLLSELSSIRRRKEAAKQVFEKARRQNKHYARLHYRNVKVH